MGSRVVIPEQIVSRVVEAVKRRQILDPDDSISIGKAAALAFAEALYEHPIVPSSEQVRTILEKYPPRDFGRKWGVEQIIKMWQEIAFVELQIPEELKPLLLPEPIDDTDSGLTCREANARLMEAYSLGQRSAKRAGA